tara:strand:+ start:20625 stop:21029 length:405 start_codon:yes stop_codon:yes gene_type:complete
MLCFCFFSFKAEAAAEDSEEFLRKIQRLVSSPSSEEMPEEEDGDDGNSIGSSFFDFDSDSSTDRGPDIPDKIRDRPHTPAPWTGVYLDRGSLNSCPAPWTGACLNRGDRIPCPAGLFQPIIFFDRTKGLPTSDE